MEDGSRVLCYPAPGGLWYPAFSNGVGPGDPGDPGEPGEPGTGASDFKWPFPKSAFNEYNGIPGGGYRPPSRPNHRGLDMSFAPASNGAPVRAIADGTVKFAGWHGDYDPSLTGGYVAWLDHGTLSNGKRYGSLYAHMQAGSLMVATGGTVSQGDQLGRVGSTGNSTGPHLHFEIWSYDDPSSPSYDKRMNPHIFMSTFNPDDLYV